MALGIMSGSEITDDDGTTRYAVHIDRLVTGQLVVSVYGCGTTKQQMDDVIFALERAAIDLKEGRFRKDGDKLS